MKLFFTLETFIIAHTKWDPSDPNNPNDKRADTDLKSDFREILSPLVGEIKELRSCGDFQSSHLIELIEDYFAEVCPLLKQHNVIIPEYDAAELLKETALNRDKAIKQLKKCRPVSAFSSETEWEHYHFGPMITEDDDFRCLARNISDFRRAFATQFNSRDLHKNLKASPSISTLVHGLNLNNDDKTQAAIKAIDKEKSEVANIDAARALRRRLGVRRYLTLNYDLELELMLFEEARATPLDAYKDFEDFLLQDELAKNRPLSYEPGRAVTLQSPSGRVVRSSSSRRKTLADLFSFGAFPTNYDASVHHLHGRVDDPDNMIITPKDYQRIYYGASDQKKSFDEARHAVFTGSDILVLGLGTKEHDVLKPLRDFLEIEADRRDAHGKVYYITATEFSGEQNSLAAAHKTACRDAMAKTQHLYKDYGMHTLFIDQSFDTQRTRTWSSDNATLFAARAEIANYLHLVGKGDEVALWWKGEGPEDQEPLSKDFKQLFGEMHSFAPGSDKNNGEISHEAMNETKLARELVREWNSVVHGPADQKGNMAKKVKAALRALDSHLRDTGLVQYVQRLEHARRAWWSDWSEFPGLRIAALGPHFYKLDKNQDPERQAKDPRFVVDTTAAFYKKKNAKPMVWKQTNLEAQISAEPATLGSQKEIPQFTGLLIATGTAREQAQLRAKALKAKIDRKAGGKPRPESSKKRRFPTEFPASVARISIPPGGGKGRLLSYFTNIQELDQPQKPKIKAWPFQTLFDPRQANNTIDNIVHAKANRDYKACYMSHLTFALEFSGTMISFARMLQQLLPNLRKEVASTPAARDPDWDRLLKHQFHGRSSTIPCIKVLRDMFDLLQRTCPNGGWKTRMVAIFSYLDRLVDSDGDAYAPTHRAFFRLISGWNNPDEHMRLPVDFIFINCHSDQPIRYLSTERPSNPAQTNGAISTGRKSRGNCATTAKWHCSTGQS